MPVTARFDHAVIAVADLERAVDAYRSLGFDVFSGGRHEQRGTHNALIRFVGGQYLELLSVYDADRAERSGPNGRALAEFLRHREGGLVGHCYAVPDIASEAARMGGRELDLVGPFGMQRQRPDGRTLTWRLLVPVDVPWRRRWPFFIQWDVPMEERLAVEGVGAHPNGASGVGGIVVGVRELGEARDLYAVLFDKETRRTGDDADLEAGRAALDLRGFTIELLAPRGNGPSRRALDRDGEGPLELTIVVEDPAVLAGVLTRSGTELEDAGEGRVRIPPEASLGARLVFAGPPPHREDRG